MAHEFHWTLPTVYEVTGNEFNRLNEEHSKSVERQNKEMKKSSPGSGKRVSIDDIGQLKGVPGVRHTKKRK